MNHLPFIVIGAPRSGTNMLRDVLCTLPGFGTWPCDEINYIWRYGNTFNVDDELESSDVSEPIKKYIRNRFRKLSEQHSLKYVVEKTCANSLRLGFVNEVMPDAKYIFIVRDGRDATASALKRWKAPVNIKYLYKKARYIPYGTFPYYITNYILNRISKLFSKEKNLSTWGPRFKGIDFYLKQHGVFAVCAEQWKRCVEKSSKELEKIDKDRVFQLKYEDFVNNPKQELIRLLDKFNINIDMQYIERSTSNVTETNIGKYKKDLTIEEIHLVENIQKEYLLRFGYVCNK